MPLLMDDTAALPHHTEREVRMTAKQFSMAEHLPPSLTFLFAFLVTLLAWLLPDPSVHHDWQVYIEALTLLAKAIAPAGTVATALFAYWRWRTERYDKQHDKKRIANLEKDARGFEGERAAFRAEIRRLVAALDTREKEHNERKLQRLEEVEGEVATLKEQVRALLDK